MESLGEFAENNSNRGGYGHIFCFSLQFASWWWRFPARTEEVEDGVGKMEVFEVDQTPSLYSREYDNYPRDLRLKHPRHTNVLEQAIQFWGKGLPFNSVLAHLRFDAPGNTKSTHLG